ncbi:MAG TPA: sugar transferase [Spirochaetia bacterium]|nr:sugar transferase [Spirochaetales bacterium]HRZ88554.1 sugar transferase [Spirochaetia bacterium]
MKEKLRKHSLSKLFAAAWSAVGAIALTWISVVEFPFARDGRILPNAVPIVVGAAVAYALLSWALARLRVHPTATNPLVVNFTATAFGLLLFMALAAARVYFSLGFLTIYILFTNAWFTLEFLLRRRFGMYTFAVVPGGYDLFSQPFPNCRLVPLASPELLPEDLDAVIVDFEQVLPEYWLAFVSRCVMEGVPVISTEDFLETETGTILLDHLTTARTLAFQKGQVYIALKRLTDTVLIVLAAPLWIPIVLMAMTAVRLESPGRALYSQMRVGRRGRPFRIFKIRSMRQDAERHGAAFAVKGDARITRLGAFLRKTRIDELPQFWNVLRGDMSLIGPRPEQVPFVQDFERTIPYYQLRHIVRPGITGWAQVTLGYAANETETAEKLAADLYYVKRLSFTLDFLIVVKTIWTMLTGFGSR